MRKALSLLVKAIVSALLLYFALDLVKFGTVASRLMRIQPGWVVVGLLGLVVQAYLAALRWREIVSACGANLPRAQMFRYTIIAAFFNQTLPSSVGGDAMRIWLLGKQANWRIAAYSVFLDRVIGVVALAALVVVCLPWSLDLVRNPIGRDALLVIGLGCLAAGIVFVFLAWERLAILQHWTIPRHLAASAKVALQILRSPRDVSAITATSLFIHFATVFAAWCAAQSVGAQLTLLNALFLVLPVILITVVPISIAGWGVRESAMVAAFSYAGLPQADGLIVSLLFGMSYLLLGVAGGLVWVLTTDRAMPHAIPESVGSE